jgi:hypothetical protein
MENEMLSKFIQLTIPLRYRFDALTYNNSHNVKALSSIKNKFYKKPILIIGNGPSLNKTPLDEFKCIPSIGMNKIDLIFPKTQWRPTYIICINNIVVQQHWESLLKNNIPTLLSWKVRHFIRKKDRNNFLYFLSLAKQDFSENVLDGLGVAGTVTYAALQFAYYMGADPVILFGVDHSFVVYGKQHQIQKRKGIDVNHFDPNYFKAGTYWGLPDLEMSGIGYQNAMIAFKKDNRIVYDATVDGKLDIFEKISINKAKKLCNLQ